MSDLWPLILVALPPTIAAVAALVVAVKSNAKIEKVHTATNSMHDALVALTAKEAHARGVIEGRAEERAHERD